ncbi:MAG: hypothetical protein QFB86_02020 [Patescibacteria group bacterium]|nr:hypothetical protein [Patescibacteria group bacterium]
MNKLKRNDKGQFAKDRSPKVLVFSWLSTLLSVILLYITSRAVMSTIGSFRSCDANSSGLIVRDCGKHSLNFGDIVILALFVAAAALTVSAFTASLRITRRTA